jgi:hypothetical protein
MAQKRSKHHPRLAVPEPKVLRAIGAESIQNRTHTLSSKRIDKIIKAARKKKSRS